MKLIYYDFFKLPFKVWLYDFAMIYIVNLHLFVSLRIYLARLLFLLCGPAGYGRIDYNGKIIYKKLTKILPMFKYLVKEYKLFFLTKLKYKYYYDDEWQTTHFVAEIGTLNLVPGARHYRELFNTRIDEVYFLTIRSSFMHHCMTHPENITRRIHYVYGDWEESLGLYVEGKLNPFKNSVRMERFRKYKKFFLARRRNFLQQIRLAVRKVVRVKR